MNLYLRIAIVVLSMVFIPGLCVPILITSELPALITVGYLTFGMYMLLMLMQVDKICEEINANGWN